MLEIVAELESAGKNLQFFCRELARFFRNLLVAKITGGDTRLIAASGPEQARLRGVAARFAEDDLTRWLQLSLDLYNQLQHSLQPRLHLELGLLRLVHAGRLKPIEEALRELRPAAGDVVPPRAPVAPRVAPPAAPRAAAPPPPPPPPPAPVVDPNSPLKTRLVAALEAASAGQSAHAVSICELVEGQGMVEFLAPRAARLGLMSKDVEKALQQLLGRPVRTKITVRDDMTAAAPEPVASTAPPPAGEAQRRALEHPDVRRYTELFPGSQVRDVRDLKE
jgi:DNA polymerase-3 subunit gamma/tau